MVPREPSDLTPGNSVPGDTIPRGIVSPGTHFSGDTIPRYTGLQGYWDMTGFNNIKA